jgi:hypothetical protein
MDYFLEVINQYKKRLDEIEQHIQFISLQKNLYNAIKSDSQMDSYTKSLGNILNSTVQYNSIIICLYGCFEEFIDEIALEYIGIIDKLCISYNELPQSIREKHLYKVGEFLSNPQRYKGYELTVDDCIKNIYMSINSSKERKLNTELIISHAGNLKIEKICDLFKDLGIKDLKSKIEDIVSKENLNLLDELVDQRNVISHSWEVEQRLAYETIENETIVVLRTIGEKLKDILLDKIFLFMYEKNMFESFDKPIQVINNKILCINSKSSYLKKGESILLLKTDNRKARLEILGIEIEHKSVDRVEEENIDIGIEVNKNIDEEWQYYYVKK